MPELISDVVQAGIAAEDRQRIFDRFHRGRQPVDTSSNTAGLGLSFARRHRRAAWRELTATQRSGGGTEFAFSLPRLSESPA